MCIRDRLITTIFKDNDNLHSYKLVPLIKRLANAIDHLAVESTKKATLLSFLPVFMTHKDTQLKDNQYLILTEFTSNARKNSNYLFTKEKGARELQMYVAEMKHQHMVFMNDEKIMAEIDIPPEL